MSLLFFFLMSLLFNTLSRLVITFFPRSSRATQSKSCLVDVSHALFILCETSVSVNNLPGKDLQGHVSLKWERLGWEKMEEAYGDPSLSWMKLSGVGLCFYFKSVARIPDMRVCVCQAVSQIQLFVIPWTVACQAPLPIKFSRQEYWSG